MTAPQPQSVIGNLTDLREDQVALPRFMVKREDGLLVDLSRLETTQDLHAAVDRIFASDACFLDLDYERFSKLLYSADPSEACNAGKGGEPESLIRFAADVVAFPPERRALYKAVKIGQGEAEYYFEQVYLETTSEEPVYSEDADGARVVVGFEEKISSEPATLTFDEFVADLWGKGVRVGMDADAVRAAIQSKKAERIVVARRIEAIPGKAADIQELAEEIHRDDAPKLLPDGRVNLSQFQNRFPQINKGVRLLKKIPLIMGITGYELSGNPIEPPIPKDFNLETLSGPGTALERNEDGEFIVSQQDGFLNIDTQSNQISITEKIINREGVSVKTTGDLVLTGDEYEEHGEVQEKRLIEGNNIVMHADVFGTVSSRGGSILLKHNLVGGSALNQAGDIVVEGVASGATLHTRRGTITLKRAENCVIVGTQVVIEHAVNCDILSEQVNIAEAEGCTIAGKRILLAQAGPHRQSEMLVFIPVPDLAELDRKTGVIRDKITEVELSIQKKQAALESATHQPDVRKYLLVATKVKKGEVTLTPEQQVNLQRMAAAASPMLKLIAKIKAEKQQIIADKQALADQAALLEQQKENAGNEIFCTITDITGDVLVRALKYTPEDEAAFYNLPPAQVKATLRGASIGGERVYAAHSGALEWKFIAPE